MGQDDVRLVRQVVLVRHGVRSPTQSLPVLQSWSSRDWPLWPVGRGELTPRGAELIMLQWQQERSRLAHLGLLPTNPDPSRLLVYADKDERTQATAEAILLGLVPGQPVSYAISQASIDPLFHPVKAGVRHLDRERVRQDILSAANGSLASLEKELAPEIRRMAAIMGQPGHDFCAENHGNADCTLASIPTRMDFGAGGDTIVLKGQLGIASSLAEIFLLEYGQWPGENAGWGQVDKAVLQQLLPVHTRIFDLVNRAPSVAEARGSLLLETMHAALTGQSSNPAINAASLVVIVGHDTNIATTGALLGVHWKLPDYPQDDIPPGSCLILNLWERGDERLVSAEFAALSMDALHAARPRAEGLERVPLSLQHFSGKGDGFLCPLDDFSAGVRAALADR